MGDLADDWIFENAIGSGGEGRIGLHQDALGLTVGFQFRVLAIRVKFKLVKPLSR